MPQFSRASLNKLASCAPDLQRLFQEVIKTHDIIILEGHRGREEQEQDYANGTSKARWGQSKHNTVPSQAVDVAPYPIDWKNTQGFKNLAAFVLATAEGMGIKIRWGGNFTTIRDLPHYELVPEEK